MKEETKGWIRRYLDAYVIVTRQIAARIKVRIPEGLTNDQFTILRLIHGQIQCTSTYLADIISVGKSSITAIINRLVEAGLIERTRDEEDRRQVYLTLTEAGRQVFDVSEKEVMEVISPYLSEFQDEDIEKFISMFEKLASLMQESGGKSN